MSHADDLWPEGEPMHEYMERGRLDAQVRDLWAVTRALTGPEWNALNRQGCTENVALDAMDERLDRTADDRTYIPNYPKRGAA